MQPKAKQEYPNNRSMLMHFLQGSKRYFAVCLLAVLLATFFDMIRPKIISFTVDAVIGGDASKVPSYFRWLVEAFGGTDRLAAKLWVIAILVVTVALFGAFFRFLFRLYNSKGSETFVQTIRNGLFCHIEHLPYSWQQENQTGDIIQRCTSDVETIKRFLSEQLTNMMRIIIMIVMSLCFMSGISGLLALLSGLYIPIIVSYSMFFHMRIYKGFREADEQEGVLSSIAQENLSGVRVVRAFGRERSEREKFEAQNNTYTNAWVRLCRLLSAFWSIGDIISGLQVLTVVAVGAVLAVRDVITPGEYIAIVSYNAMLVWPVRGLGRVISEMSKAGVSIERVRYIMNAEVEHDREGALEPPMDGDIEFDHVRFSYDSDSAPVLKDVSFTVKAGTTVGILGGTGSGKSTLMYLLAGLYPLEEGCGAIRIGGVDIADIKREHLRENVGLALQEPFLFSRSLAENIGIAKPGADMKTIRKASRIASLEETADRFAKGYDTPVGERGVTLSGGQKQRTSIAQMVIRETPIKVFDDALSAVDTETDARIRKALLEESKDSTVIIISHRITTLMQADDIIVLNDGCVAEEGTHEELLARGGIYARICEIQASGLADGQTVPDAGEIQKGGQSDE
ncbi:MAG: ABC transporter ATP-binding protein [Lachnospiraceae bacterium]|nr:ABC transporter ATP-binding protein [Lachnospiraceae bacterium]